MYGLTIGALLAFLRKVHNISYFANPIVYHAALIGYPFAFIPYYLFSAAYDGKSLDWTWKKLQSDSLQQVELKILPIMVDYFYVTSTKLTNPYLLVGLTTIRVISQIYMTSIYHGRTQFGFQFDD
jgi:hypothetical protein